MKIAFFPGDLISATGIALLSTPAWKVLDVDIDRPEVGDGLLGECDDISARRVSGIEENDTGVFDLLDLELPHVSLVLSGKSSLDHAQGVEWSRDTVLFSYFAHDIDRP